MLTIVDEWKRGFALGAVDYLTKPIDSERLVGLVDRHRRDQIGIESAATDYILIVEDDATLRELLHRTLEQAGLDVIAAADGQEALVQVARSRPSLILLDLMLPDLDGVQVIEELHATPAGQAIPIVVLTAKDLTSAEQQRLNRSVAQILQKGTYSSEDLLRKVCELTRTYTQQCNRLLEETNA